MLTTDARRSPWRTAWGKVSILAAMVGISCCRHHGGGIPKTAALLGKYVHNSLLTEADLEQAILSACSSNGALQKYKRDDLCKQIRNGLNKARGDPSWHGSDRSPTGRRLGVTRTIAVAEAWPRLIGARTAAAYVNERSVRAFRRAIGTL
jgi:hypothetical protein